MKKILHIICLLLVFSTVHSQIQTIPYCDNFNGATLWTVDSVSGSVWQQGSPNFGTTSSSHTPPSCFDVELAAAYLPSTLTYLTSPAFDFSSAFNSKVSFWQNWNTEAGWDGNRMEFTIDSGLTWAVLGTVADPNATNWYTSATINSSGMPAWAGNSGGWIKSTYNLSFLDGYSSVIFRFVFTSDPSVAVDGFSIDDFCITMPPPLDAGLEQIIEPNPVLPANSSQQVKVRVKNYGSQAFNSFMVSYQLDAGSIIGPINFPLPLTPNSSADVILPNVIIPAGTHTLCAFTTLIGDANFLNDTLRITIEGISTATLPYYDNFDGANNGWTTSAINTATVWELGTPNFGATSTSYSAPNSWDINLNSSYQPSAMATLTSPYFDFTNALDAKLSFAVNYNTEMGWDGVRCEYRATDSVWHLLGAVGSPNSVNWYTNNIVSSGLDSWAGNSGGWKKCEYNNLNMLSGASDVQFRFVFTSDPSVQVDGFSLDDFQILLPVLNAAATQAISTTNLLLSTAPQYYKALVVNTGLTALSNVSVSLSVDGTTVLTETATFNPPLNYSDSKWYAFIAPWSAAPGAHIICTYTSNPNGVVDLVNFDDTTCYAFNILDSASVFPYCNDFENSVNWPVFDPQTWQHDSLWQKGTPNKTVINTAHSGLNCWTTNLSSTYGNNKSSALISPVFYLQQGSCYKLSFWQQFQTEFLKDGGTVEYSTDNGFSWTVVGWVGDPDWFNTNAVAAFGVIPISGWSGLQNTWTWAQHEIYSANGGEYVFRFRFGSNATNNNYDGWAIDDLCFEEIASPCFAGITDNLGTDFSLAQNVPNPASDIATINFVLPGNKNATLRILDMLGNILVEKNVKGSTTQVDVKALTKGVYFYELEYNNQRLIKKMVVVR